MSKKTKFDVIYDISIGILVVFVGALFALWFDGWQEERREKQEYRDIMSTIFVEAVDNIGRTIKINQNTSTKTVSAYRFSCSALKSALPSPVFSRYAEPVDVIELSTMDRRIDLCNKMLDFLASANPQSELRDKNIEHLRKNLKRLYGSMVKFVNRHEKLAERVRSEISEQDIAYLKDIGISMFFKDEGKSYDEFVNELDDQKDSDSPYDP